MTALRSLFLSLLVWPILVFAALAEDAVAFPEPLAETVSDFAGVLDATAEGRISRILAQIEEETGARIVLVTAAGTEGLNGAGMALEDLARGLFDAWNVSGKKRDDGVMILIDTTAREARITLGTGYEPVYDDRAALVLSTTVLPKLRSGLLIDGIEAGIVSARDKLILPHQKGDPVTATEGFEVAPISYLLPALAVLVGLAAVAGFLLWQRVRARKRCPKCRALTLNRTDEIITRPTRYQDGLGLEHLNCASCGYVDRKSYPIPRLEPKKKRARPDAAAPGAPAEAGAKAETERET